MVVLAAPGLVVLVPLVADVLPREVAPVFAEPLVFGPVDDGPGEDILPPTVAGVFVWAEATPSASKKTEGAIHNLCMSNSL